MIGKICWWFLPIVLIYFDVFSVFNQRNTNRGDFSFLIKYNAEIVFYLLINNL